LSFISNNIILAAHGPGGRHQEGFMLALRHAEQRGQANFGWLDSRHTFSFGHYYDPDYMGFGPLRVINEDRVQPGKGFGTHGHRDMEIISYVLDGALEHKDSMGNGSIIRPGDVQRMTAGTGVRHSEFNASDSEPVHFLQIWILPERDGLDPGYEQKNFPAAERRGGLRLIGSRNGRDGSVTIHQDVDLYAALLGDGERVSQALAEGRKGWVQVARGSASLNDRQLYPGDGVAIQGPVSVDILASSEAEILLFDMG
jgi:redox-sensitive bicupin YhaK (pirin superfamily)